ncbi:MULTISPECIES: cupin domain-containing protein [unclassified Nonomuraea]|uniref:cupin domain-containing protein n=1 Tax=unclassified Nonomuraea TaxID=2593643 RepID=UPI0035BEDE7A
MTSNAARIRNPAITTPDTQQTVSFLGELYHLRVTGHDTGGAFAVIESRGRRGHGSPMHVHRADSETFVVLEGELRVVVDGQEHRAGAGCAAVLPAGRPHGFVVTSDSARYLTLHHGPGFADFVIDAGGATPDPAALSEIAARHGIDIVGPPPLP